MGFVRGRLLRLVGRCVAGIVGELLDGENG